MDGVVVNGDDGRSAMVAAARWRWSVRQGEKKKKKMFYPSYPSPFSFNLDRRPFFNNISMVIFY